MSRTQQHLGIDFGARSVRAVWVSMRGGRPVVTRAETFALPLDAEEPHKLISAWIDSLGLSKRFCSVALPGGQTIFQSGRIMANDPRTPEQVADIEIAQYNEMAGDEMDYTVAAFDCPIEHGARRYIMALARPAAITEAINTTRLNHLRPSGLTPAPVALYNAMEALSTPRDTVRCYAHIGHNTTEVAVGTSAGPLFARSIPVGAKLFTEAVAQAASLSPVQAEVRKHKECGLNEGQGNCAELRAAADRWLSQFNACMGVYRSQFHDRRLVIKQLVLSGGGAQLPGLKEYISDKLSLEVAGVESLDNVPESVKKLKGSYEIALGLALSTMEQGRTRLSLLPESLKNEVVFRQKKPWWMAAAFLLLATMVIYSATGMTLLKRDGALLRSEQEKLAERKRIDQRIRSLRQMQSQILTNAVPLSNLLVNGPLARETMIMVASAISPDDWITLFCDERTYTQREQQAEADSDSSHPAPNNPFTLFRTIKAPAKADTRKKERAERKALVDPLSTIFIAEGYTPNPSLKSVREMIARLKTSPMVARVDLRSDDQVLPPTGIPELEAEDIPNFRRFVIEIEIKR